MAIDFGRMFRNVATGYLGAKIANTEANDKLNANIIERAGLNFYENTLPKWQESEKNREETYGKVSAQYGKDVAEYMDQNGFIAGNASDYKNIVTLLGSNDGMNETKLKAYLEATSAGTYAERAEKRASKIQDKEKTIMGLTSGSSKIGNMTAELLLKDDETATDAGTGQTMATETVTVPGEMVPGTPIKTMDTKETREIPLPSYAEIFGDTDKAETVYLKMDREDKVAIKKLSNTEFKNKFYNDVTGLVEIPKIYKEEYENLSEEEKKKDTLISYAQDRYFKEEFLPDQGYSYTTPLPQDIIEASSLINYYNSIGDDKMVNEIKIRLKNAGYDLKDYNLG